MMTKIHAVQVSARSLPVALLLSSMIFGVGNAAQPFEVTPLPDKRNLHGSAVHGNHLYVVSGDEPMPKGFTNKVHSARINDDRSLGPWFENTPLPINLIYIANNVMVVDNHLYVVGGQEVSDIPGAANPGSEYNAAPNNSAVYAPIGADGRLGQWQRSGRYAGEGGQGAAATTDGRFLYVTGGINKAGIAQREVFYARIQRGTGSVGPWAATAPLPSPLWSHSLFFHNGNLYTLGGRMGSEMSSVTDAVMVSYVNDDGTLQPWRISPMKLAFPVELASACAADDFLFLFCGRDPGGRIVEQIQFSRLTGDGISPWRSIGTSMAARIYSSAALDPVRRAVYITGGRFTTNYADTTDRAYCFPLRATAHASAPASTTTAVNTFLPHQEAYALATSQGKPVFLMVYSNSIEFTRADLQTLCQSAAFGAGTSNLVLGSLDAAAHPEVARNLGLIRVPAYLIIGPDGSLRASMSGRKSEAELLQFIAAHGS
jgi:hypothetical protein